MAGDIRPNAHTDDEKTMTMMRMIKMMIMMIIMMITIMVMMILMMIIMMILMMTTMMTTMVVVHLSRWQYCTTPGMH